MIPPWKIQAIEALLAEDALSQRAIAKRLQVGRSVVAGIANGTRPNYHVPCQAEVPPPPAAQQPTERCPECGAMVQFPCLACRARRAMVRGRRWPRIDLLPASEGLQLKLIGPEQSRYEEVRARRRSLLGLEGRPRSADHRRGVSCIFRGPDRPPR
ncbi:MAG: hypothetical protein ACLQLG_12915 [Thermoguttaceae bacterium]